MIELTLSAASQTSFSNFTVTSKRDVESTAGELIIIILTWPKLDLFYFWCSSHPDQFEWRSDKKKEDIQALK